uniref:SWIM-type domain-containing protein n=1 Tax=Sphenodon punctatus TaxID=8508 RepID=A0A8D0HHL3_SPHPU
MEVTLPVMVEELLKEVQKAFQEMLQVPAGLLLALKYVFSLTALPALDLVDQCSVTLVMSPSGRTVYQVLRSSIKLYTCCYSCHFYTCPSDSLVCKHILAVYLSRGMPGAARLRQAAEQYLPALAESKREFSPE